MRCSGGGEGKEGVQRPAQIDRRLYRVHAPSVHRVISRPQEHREFLLPLRLALRLDFRTFTGVVEVEKRADHHVQGRYPDGCSITPGSRTARRSARWISLSPA